MTEASPAEAGPATAPPPPPPGFDGVAAGTAAPDPEHADEVAVIAAAVAATAIEPPGEDVDAPDPTLKSGELNAQAEAVIEITKEIAEGATPYTSAKTFQELNLSEELLKGLFVEMGFTKPSRVQAETLPMILGRPARHLIAQAHNGSGKTTCFVLGMLSQCDPTLHKPQALCMCPTRELVVQNVAVLRKMATHTGITCMHSAFETSKAHATQSKMPPISDHVVIATPGTLNNWLQRKQLPMKGIKVVVFDEADEMWSKDGFATDSLKILKTLRDGGAAYQVLLFSATFSETVRVFAEKVVGAQANKLFLKAEELSLEVIKQYRVECPNTLAKEAVLTKMIFPAAEKLGQSIIFVRSRARAKQLHDTLEAGGYKCTSISGQATHEERDKVIREFRAGTTKVLISTDVLSRGFDHAAVTLVVNFDPPMTVSGNQPAYETYMHRIGRSGRFGRRGAAFNLICGEEEKRTLDAISGHFSHPIPPVPYNDEEAFEEVLKKAGLA